MAPQPVPTSQTRNGASSATRPGVIAVVMRSSASSTSGLGLRARDEHARVDVQRDAVELLEAPDVGDGLAGLAALHERLEGRLMAAPNGASGCAGPAAAVQPRTWPRSSSASRRGVSEPADAQAVGSARGGARCPAGHRACTSGPSLEDGQPFGLVGRDQRIDEAVEVAVEDRRQVVQVHADAVVGDAVLREVVGPDLLRPIARADHRAPRGGLRLVRLALLHLEQAGAQHGHRLGLVLVLALLVLDRDHEAGRQVGDAHGRVGRVDALAARARTSARRRCAGPCPRRSGPRPRRPRAAPPRSRSRCGCGRSTRSPGRAGRDGRRPRT